MSACDLNLDFPGVILTDVYLTPTLAVVVLVSTAAESSCPSCHNPSARVHSRYVRTLADLPGHNRPVALRLTVRRFFCSQPHCARSIFCERLPDFVAPYARGTDRRNEAHTLVGFALGGEPGRRLTEHLAMPTSGDTLLRRVQASPDPALGPVRFVGIDDWAFRKGQRYGTIVVDLERGRVIDLLPDREPATVETWLRDHPGVEVITRDRARAYAKGATDGAPQAQQVADRWHVLKNLREAVEQLLSRLVGSLDEIQSESLSRPVTAESPTLSPVESVPNESQSTPPERGARIESARSDDPRTEAFEAVQRLHHEGRSIRQIVVELGLSRNTVRRYLRSTRLPTRRRGTRLYGGLLVHASWIDQRIAEGITNASALHRELRARGVNVSVATARRWVARRLPATERTGRRSRVTRSALTRTVTVRQMSFEWVKAPEKRTADEQSRVERLRSMTDELKVGLDLADEFAGLVRKTTTSTLEEWQARAETCACAEMRRFAEGIRQDEAAVRAAVTTPWSNGPVEGQVNRLKRIRRQMYGRGALNLLRKRVMNKG